MNVDALPDLLSACKNALGVYEALNLVGADKHLPGYESCLRDLKAAIAKAENSQDIYRRTNTNRNTRKTTTPR